jgi:hypothetical protein
MRLWSNPSETAEFPRTCRLDPQWEDVDGGCCRDRLHLDLRRSRFSRRRPHWPDGSAPHAVGHVPALCRLDDHRSHMAAAPRRYRRQRHRRLYCPPECGFLCSTPSPFGPSISPAGASEELLLLACVHRSRLLRPRELGSWSERQTGPERTKIVVFFRSVALRIVLSRRFAPRDPGTYEAGKRLREGGSPWKKRARERTYYSCRATSSIAPLPTPAIT